VNKVLAFLQQLVNADRTPIAAGIIGILGILAARAGLHLNGSDTAYVSAAVFGLLSLFTHAHFANQAAAVTPGEHAKS
jgi:hypothetical protein